MLDITMNTRDAYQMVANHFNEHIAEYKLQVKGWQEQMEQYGKDIVAWSQSGKGKKPEPPVEPRSYRQDYLNLLEVLRAHTEQQIQLNEHQVRMVVLNEFRWMHQFVTQSATYGGNMANDLAGEGFASEAEAGGLLEEVEALTAVFKSTDMAMEVESVVEDEESDDQEA